MPLASHTEAPAAAVELGLLSRRLDFCPDPERAFVHMYGRSQNAFWLDSSGGGERGRFSFMGDSEGPLGAIVTYDVTAGQVRVECQAGVEVHDESIFEYLGRESQSLRRLSADLPFDFACGFAGFFGYELKADCGAEAAHQAATPDAALVFADRMVAFDHREGHAYLLALITPGAEDWINETGRRLEALPSLPEPKLQPEPLDLHMRCSSGRYRDQIEACKRYLHAGHSYEICLTNKLVAEASPDPLELYRSLRRVNPAPFAAYLRFGKLAVLSSSPERFLALDREGGAEARPIKGTSRRSVTPEEDVRLATALRADEKNRAENVTIVDLLRNDLGRVCEIGSVEVPELMRVESYETVHQLVSSVRGRLREDVGPVECIRACFPPGSMTGAPKLRTMEILDELEGEARGPYSGAIGYLGLGGGCDLSVAIRAIVLDGEEAVIGAGGAVVVDSSPEEEFEEMLLKADATVSAFEASTQFFCRT
ncbi:MAG TPA: aminodeoxychorismate synthase component I [Solirubrobacterales bacterium]|jgi:para-aminobenzoate synthetase